MGVSRQNIIASVIGDLEKLRQDGNFGNGYAVDTNMSFFSATRSLPKYLWWLFTKAPYIDREKLLELTDLPFPHWDEKMHLRLIELEKKTFPGLVAPFVKRLLDFVKYSNWKRPLVLVDFGSGGMEVERQLIESLLGSGSRKDIIIVGIDKSPVTHRIAKENLKNFDSQITIRETQSINAGYLNEEVKNRPHHISVILCQNDIFSLSSDFQRGSIDLIYHSFFKHHLSPNEKSKLQTDSYKLAKNVIEYDGYKSWFHILIPHTITGWSDPVFLNATILSDLRYFNKDELEKIKTNDQQLSIYIRGTYMLEFSTSIE